MPCDHKTNFRHLHWGTLKHTRGTFLNIPGEPVPPADPIRFLNPNPKNPSSAAWLGNKRGDSRKSRFVLLTVNPSVISPRLFPNQAALEGFLELGLRNRIGLHGGTGSPGFGGWFPRIPPGSPKIPPRSPQDPPRISYGHRRYRMVHPDKNKKCLFLKIHINRLFLMKKALKICKQDRERINITKIGNQEPEL